MTERLYYDNAYLTEFDAAVTACDALDGKYLVYLDRSAFYPTSGGQPYDTGTIDGAHILDVFVDANHDVCHVTDAPLDVGQTVRGRIDWPRRFEHMQQHAGDHMIASAIWRHFGGVTIGLHLGETVSTIDVDMPGGITHLTPEQVRLIERDVNARIQRDVPVCCWFPTPEELEGLPLRKKPTVTEHVRVVAIGDDEMVACGGTHPATAGQIGLVKIVGAAPARGKLRVSFLAGMRAYGDYQQKYDIAQAASNLLSTSVENLPAHVAALQESLKQAEYALNHLRREAALNAIVPDELPVRPDGVRVAARMLDGDMNLIKDVASQLIRQSGVVALLGAEVESGRAVFVFARSQDVDIHMGQLLSRAAKPLGGKGGGRPDFAQGGGAPEILDLAASLLMEG